MVPLGNQEILDYTKCGLNPPNDVYYHQKMKSTVANYRPWPAHEKLNNDSDDARLW